MNDTGAARGTQAVSATPRARAVNFTLWALQSLLALQFAMAGFVKVIGDPTMVEMFATIGIGQWFRYVVGRWRSPGPSACWSRGAVGLAAILNWLRP